MRNLRSNSEDNLCSHDQCIMSIAPLICLSLYKLCTKLSLGGNHQGIVLISDETKNETTHELYI